MRGGVQDRGPGSPHVSARAPKGAPGTDAITTAMRSGMLWGVRKRPLPRGVCGPINIDHVPGLSLPIPQPTRGRAERRSGHQIGGNEGPSCLHTRLIQRSQKAGEGAAMGQEAAFEPCHEGFAKGSQACRKSVEAGFIAERRADEHGDTLDQVLMITPRPCTPHLRLDALEHAMGCEDLSHQSDVSEPPRRGRSRFWDTVDRNGCLCHTGSLFSLEDDAVCCVDL
jgi:hypothetical protein